ncbi:hypothetical protein ANN_03715 [Periplaneta americana]|uniref:Uncharacterized protein n=1 Tax=Periplaneta americana TaxID=6978 RepID=A0ABQ8U1T3_PERAM|nr:hypothetical protein ANN_03715 [Periplaneta americana]
MLAGSEFQSLGRAIVKEDEYEEVRWDGIVSIVSWRERVFRLWWEERCIDLETQIELNPRFHEDFNTEEEDESIFQQDDAPPHFHNHVREYINVGLAAALPKTKT